MHSDLQTVSQTPQLTHVSLLTTILKSENLEINPKNVPTGQIELQKNLPLLNENRTTIKNTVSENRGAKISTLLKVEGEIE